ncbi:MAG: aminomethyl-transferring glycine dehydrogenase subunit GcvPA [Syntrophales bacterium]|jgi:glycine dehydrogenase subunit 1|nr:aminomethyl-transferring glycine dehydrogenase subunit GcvPA [Syntrophales bacterium]MCK9391431.1 aminomethyl-transferring glycine dehydrogenase subunit GcvPA [Syntrophales bacterium]
MDYVPHTPADEQRMMQAIGIASLDDLFTDIPSRFLLKKALQLPPGVSEMELADFMDHLSKKNELPAITLMGAGAYRHWIPAVVGHIISRSEFYTAYTPYQAEISQGILQAIYEYQTMIARLTGMQVANASMYDGATAMAEAAVLAAKTLNRKKLVLANSIHPEYRQVVRTYAWANGYEVVVIPFTAAGQLDMDNLRQTVDKDTAAVLIQSPNFFGVLENIAPVAAVTRDQGALFVSGFTEATSLGILKPAGAMGADFAVGEGQAFGNPLNYGGPYLGIFASTDKFLRKIPGRLAGATVDKEGNRGFVLTLQTREQHIRRERATSNICTNEALCALAAAVYLVSLGKNLKMIAELNVQKAQYLRSRLLALPGFSPAFSGPVYNEFAVRCPDPVAINQKLQEAGIIGGYKLGCDYPEFQDSILFCATEMLSKDDIDKVVMIIS